MDESQAKAPVESLRRAKATKRRKLRTSLAVATAAEGVGPITKDAEIFGFTKGQFSLIDIILHVLDTTGPNTRGLISTWTAGNADLSILLEEERLTELRFVIDFSFPQRQPDYCAAMRDKFGDKSIRLTKVHAKFVTLRSERADVCIRTSANLNYNRRLEQFEITEGAEMCDYVDRVVEEIFAKLPESEQFEQGPYAREKDFEGLWEDQSKYFSDEAYGKDVRRVGFTTERGLRPPEFKRTNEHNPNEGEI